MSHIGGVRSSTEKIFFCYTATRLSDAKIMELWARRNELPLFTGKVVTPDDVYGWGEFEPDLFAVKVIAPTLEGAPISDDSGEYTIFEMLNSRP